jgi:PAS domain-containing protein
MTSAARQTLLFSIAILVALQLVTSLVAIVLLGRMSPAIESILEENVQSVAAVEEMLGALHATPRTDAEQARFEAAFQRARANVTEDDERPALATLEQHRAGAWAGDEGSLRQTVSALRTLGEVNRRAMQRSDLGAQRLGVAGAWAAVLLGLLALGLSVLILRRLQTSLLVPLDEMTAVVAAVERGDDHRRCAVYPSAGREVQRIMRAINTLLDEHQLPAADVATSGLQPPLPAVLDILPGAVAILDDEGGVVASNQNALERLASDDAAKLREQLRSRQGIAAQQLGERWWLCTLPSQDSASD